MDTEKFKLLIKKIKSTLGLVHVSGTLPEWHPAHQEQDIPKTLTCNTYANITPYEEFKKEIGYNPVIPRGLNRRPLPAMDRQLLCFILLPTSDNQLNVLDQKHITPKRSTYVLRTMLGFFSRCSHPVRSTENYFAQILNKRI